MFKLTHPLPNRCWVAVSGGIDSVVALHWLAQVPDRVLGIFHVNHNTGLYADTAEENVKILAGKYDVKYIGYRITGKPPTGESKEAWWREKRYEFFHKTTDPVVIAHHLDDCVEEYLMNTIVRGRIGTIPYSNKNCIRPFRGWKRKDISHYFAKNNLKALLDPSNEDISFKRNYIRHELMRHILYLNPGIYKTVRKLL